MVCEVYKVWYASVLEIYRTTAHVTPFPVSTLGVWDPDSYRAMGSVVSLIASRALSCLRAARSGLFQRRAAFLVKNNAGGYGGHKGQAIYHPDIKAQIHSSFEAYKNAKTTTVNHFYEKLLLLKDGMNTNEGMRIAEKRHSFLENYLEQFLKEWDSVDI